MNEPKEITAGFYYSWSENLSDYPYSQGYRLKYKAIKSDSNFSLTASSGEDGDSHLVEITSETSSGYTAGVYQLTKYVEGLDGNKIHLGNTSLTVLFNPIDSGNTDTRTHERIMLEAIEALEQGRATKQQKSFSIAGRGIEYLSPEELIKWKNHYKRIVYAQEGIIINKKRLVKFQNP